MLWCHMVDCILQKLMGTLHQKLSIHLSQLLMAIILHSPCSDLYMTFIKDGF